jgi:hypothetical protein
VAYQEEIAALDAERFKCIDESGVTFAMTWLYGRSPRGERVVGTVPQNYGFGRVYLLASHQHMDTTTVSRTRARGSIMSQTPTAHIHLDEAGVAWIDDTNVKVIEVVLDKLAHGSSPEEMHLQYPHLSLAQIHAALS